MRVPPEGKTGALSGAALATTGPRASTWRVNTVTAAAIGVVVFGVLNANGREIPSADSQAAKYASAMLARRHALTLDGLVGRVPLYGERAAFQRDRQGHWRNAYPLPPVLEAAAVATILRTTGAVHLDAPLAPALVAKLTASTLISVAAALAFLIARTYATMMPAIAVAAGFALGTGMWPVASQTLWQHASVVWTVTAATWLWVSAATPRRTRVLVILGALLGWAVSARPQTFPMIAVLMAGVLWDATRRERVACATGFLIPAVLFAALNVHWFGSLSGKAAEFAATSLAVHGVRRTWQWPGPGLVGLLFSPSRGLLVFSPIVLAIVAARPAAAERLVLRSTLAAALVQLLVYASFSVWWGGHTYGPRYLLDVVPLLLPAAAMGAARIASGGRGVRLCAAAALAWSIVAAGTGAFCYPRDEWNTDPASVDQFHERLWDVRDSQIARCWARGLSPQNWTLTTRQAWRRTR